MRAVTINCEFNLPHLIRIPLGMSVHSFIILPTVTGTSQSALTTVSVDDLEDSDFSDWT